MGIPYYKHYIENFKCKYCNNTVDKIEVKSEIYSTSYFDLFKRNKVHCPICNKPNFVRSKYNTSTTIVTNIYGLADEYTLTEEEFNNKIINHLKNLIEIKIKNTKEASESIITERKRKKKLKELESELIELENNPTKFIDSYMI